MLFCFTLHSSTIAGVEPLWDQVVGHFLEVIMILNGMHTAYAIYDLVDLTISFAAC